MSRSLLPNNWLLSHPASRGSGNGDEMFFPTLSRWDTRTVGHFWWKRDAAEWRFVIDFPFGTDEQAIDWAVRTEANLRAHEMSIGYLDD